MDSSREEASSARDGYTSLMMACHNGHVEIVRLLVEKGADLEAQNKSYASSVFLVEPKLRTRFCIA